MAKKITREQALQLQNRAEELKQLKKRDTIPVVSRTEEKKKKRIKLENDKIKLWKKRGGFTPKRAKHWGDPCSYTECEKWEDGECAYTERDSEGCYMLKDGVNLDV